MFAIRNWLYISEKDDIMNIYENDVFSQPEDLRRAVGYYKEQDYFQKIGNLAKNKFGKIILTGMGSSYSACLNAASKLRIHGFSCVVQATSQLLHYELASVDADTLLVVVSQSGRSGEIVELVEKLEVPCTVVGLTNDAESPLGKRSDLMLNIFVRPEQAVSTRTYLAPLILMELLTRAILGESSEEFFKAAEAEIAYLEQDIGRFFEIQNQMEEFLQMPPYITLIGRGYDQCTVDAGSLFIRELAKFPSIPFDAGQFRHGPFEMSGKDFHGIIFATEGPGCTMQLGLAQDIAEHGGKIVVVTDSDQIKSSSNILVVRQNYVSHDLACLSNILPVQCFGNYIAKRKGLTVGEFLFSSKITTKQ